MTNRKKLQEFINYFGHTRRPYDQTDSCGCLAAHAKHWFQAGGRRAPMYHAYPSDLMRAFGVSDLEAHAMYRATPLGYLKTTKADALAMLRWLLKTGKVDWDRAQGTAR